MEAAAQISQAIVAVSIINVWLFRRRQETKWRGGDARNMSEEFAVYGLPAWSMPVVGTIKVICALLLILGIFVPAATEPAAIGLATLMGAAVVMHVKVRYPLLKSVPAFSLLLLCSFILYTHSPGLMTADTLRSVN